MASYGQSQAIYGLSVVDVDLPTLSPLVVAKGTSRIITVTLVSFTPTVYAAATLTFVDSLTGIAIGRIDVPAVPPVGDNGSHEFTLSWGPIGTKLTAGANLILGGNATGRLHIESYQKGR